MGLDGDASGGKRDSGFCDDLLDFRQKLLAFLRRNVRLTRCLCGFRNASASPQRLVQEAGHNFHLRTLTAGCQPSV